MKHYVTAVICIFDFRHGYTTGDNLGSMHAWASRLTLQRVPLKYTRQFNPGAHDHGLSDSLTSSYTQANNHRSSACLSDHLRYLQRSCP